MSDLQAIPPVNGCFARSTICMPLVSLVVTNYNYSKFLRSCLSSITCQTYGNIECIIVDDASHDDSDVTIRDFLGDKAGKGQFQYVRNTESGRELDCFRIGLARASGDFVVFVDSDDLLFSDFIETHVRHHLRADSVYAFSCTDLVQIGADGQVLAGTFYWVDRAAGGQQDAGRAR